MRQHAEAARSSGDTHLGSSRRGCTSKIRSSITSAARDGRNECQCGRGPFQSIFFACGVRVVRHIGFEFMISEGFGWVASGAGRRARHHSVTDIGARSPRFSHATWEACFAAMCISMHDHPCQCSVPQPSRPSPVRLAILARRARESDELCVPDSGNSSQLSLTSLHFTSLSQLYATHARFWKSHFVPFLRSRRHPDSHAGALQKGSKTEHLEIESRQSGYVG